MDYAIRQLTNADLDACKGLLRMFGEVFEDVETYQSAVPDEAYLRALLAKPTVVALVAELGGVVVGGLVAYVLDKLERARSELYIYDLAMAEAHRRKGIARELIHALEPIARAKGAWVIYVQADPIDDPAVALYTGLGKREDVYHFDIPVTVQPER